MLRVEDVQVVAAKILSDITAPALWRRYVTVQAAIGIAIYNQRQQSRGPAGAQAMRWRPPWRAPTASRSADRQILPWGPERHRLGTKMP